MNFHQDTPLCKIRGGTQQSNRQICLYLNLNLNLKINNYEKTAIYI